MDYNFIKIEEKWQDVWEKNKSFKTPNFSDKPKFYILDMFPYPSSNGLHVGHMEGYTATDIYSRFLRMKNYNVLSPMGYDGFGLPAEQYAILTGKNPGDFTYENINNFTKQIIQSGKGIDWDRTFATCDNDYYKWTQWIFKKLYENNLAELQELEVNWCEGLGTVLANDEIVTKNGVMVSERGSFPVTKRKMWQWVLKITKYADRLLEDIDLLDWPNDIKEIQRNWIGKSVGAEVKFRVEDLDINLECFTTRPDTIYGVSYLAIAPEHDLALELCTPDEFNSVKNYIKLALQKTDIEREMAKSKTGVFTGRFAFNPISGNKVPIFVADYVIGKYGTGAVMGVPAHDERDFLFAKHHGLDIVKIIDVEDNLLPYTGDGSHINSDLINELNNEEGSSVIIDYLSKNNLGNKKVNYKLRDWVFSRQRYWGEPFPIYYDEEGKIHLVDDKDLPFELPYMENIKPSGTGESPLANNLDWLYFEKDGKKYKKETNTMPQVAGSSWYYIAYILRKENKFVDLDSKEAKELLKEWLPVDLYVGGKEHAVGHLLYARFWHKFLFDLGIVSCPEPFKKLVNQGMILSGSQKMSKSKGQTVSPDQIRLSHGSDSLRLYEMFMGPLTSDKPWNTTMLDGAKRFLDRVVRMFDFYEKDSKDDLEIVYAKTVKKVEEDFYSLSYNTAISQMMVFVNEVYKNQKINYEHALGFLKLLNPICPHITEELNEVILQNSEHLLNSKFPTYDKKCLEEDTMTIAVQVNGKLRATIEVSKDLGEEEIKKISLNQENVKKFTKNLNILKIIYVKGKIVNIVVK